MGSLSTWGSCFSPVWTAAAWIPKPLVHPWNGWRSGSAGQGLSPLLPWTGSLGRMGEGDQLRLECGRERQGPGRRVSLGARVSLERGAWSSCMHSPSPGQQEFSGLLPRSQRQSWLRVDPQPGLRLSSQRETPVGGAPRPQLPRSSPQRRQGSRAFPALPGRDPLPSAEPGPATGSLKDGDPAAHLDAGHP